MATIKEVFELPRFSDLELITLAVKDLTTEIKSVEVFETPDIEHFIPEGVFLLTTAMSYDGRQEALIPLIDSLIRAKSVGLGIKLGRFLGELEPEVVAYAESVSFPIFSIPDSFSLGSILHQMLNIIWEARFEEISFALDIQKRFSDLLIQDATNDILINEFSQIVKTPIILVNPFQEVMSHSVHFNHSTNRATHYVQETFAKRLETGKESGSYMIKDAAGKEMHVSLIPIKVHTYFPHYLVILNPEHIPYPISKFAIEQAAIVLSFILFKNERVDDSKFSVETDYFKELIDYTLYHQNTDVAVREPNLKFGYRASDYYQIIHLAEETSVSSRKLTAYGEEQLLVASHWARDHVKHYFENAIVLYFNTTKDIILLLQHKPTDLALSLTQMRDDLAATLPIQLVFSIGNPYPNWTQLNQSYTQARLVFEDRKKEPQQTIIKSYENKGIFHLFNHLESQDVRFFCQTTLKTLAYPEESSFVELRKTLHAYLNAQCEIASTAATLFVHRNTVKYRIQRIEEILGFRVNSPEHSLNLRLALELSENQS